MSARDPVAAILAGLDRPVVPRPEFGTELLARLLEELGEDRAPARRPWRVSFRLPRILPGAPPRLRLALIVLALLLLLAGIATATYFGVKTWISAGPRGVQFTSDFRLVELARGVEYGRIALAPNGDELYGISMPARHAQPDLRRAAIVQVSGLRGERVRSDVALRLLDLKQNPALWDPGADFSGLVVPEIFTVPEFSPKPSIAPNGDLAFVASVSPATTLSSFFKSGAKSTSLLVWHRDGKVEKVLTVRELVAAGLLNPAAASQANMLFAVAFSAPDRLFLYVNDEPGRNRFRSFYEIVDPNGDGDWADRKVTPLALPAFLGFDRPIWFEAGTAPGRRAAVGRCRRRAVRGSFDGPIEGLLRGGADERHHLVPEAAGGAASAGGGHVAPHRVGVREPLALRAALAHVPLAVRLDLLQPDPEALLVSLT